MRFNDKGQCPNCKCELRVYERKRMKMCLICDREFDIETLEQVENFAWREISPGVFEDAFRNPHGSPGNY